MEAKNITVDYEFGIKPPGVEFLCEEYGELEITENEWKSDRLFQILEERLGKNLEPGSVPLRFAVTHAEASNTGLNNIPYEVGVLKNLDLVKSSLNSQTRRNNLDSLSIFEFKKRKVTNQREFNVAFVLPTGTGCELGGHAGDAGAVSRLLGSVCDHLVTHPNAVNASDLNEMPGNALYVEGSVLAQVLMGTRGLSPVRSNRVMAVIHDRKLDEKTAEEAVEAEIYANCAVNMINGGRASAGYHTEEITMINGI